MSVIHEVEQHEIDAWLDVARDEMTDEQYADFCQQAREAGPDGDWTSICKAILGDD